MNGAGLPGELVPEAIRVRCVYCLQSNHLRNDQILMRGKALYLCAPRGQIAEGFLTIAPYDCNGSLSLLPADNFPELISIKKFVADFYREAYGVEQGTYYEQGRGGGGAMVDEIGGFPHHAHLCCLPVSLDLHTPLSAQYAPIGLSGPEELPAATRNNPYLYVEGAHRELGYQCRVYLARSGQGRSELERKRLKPTVAALMGLPERGDWRAYPGDGELERVIRKFFHIQNRRILGNV
jgi:hypothetical protein